MKAFTQDHKYHKYDKYDIYTYRNQNPQTKICQKTSNWGENQVLCGGRRTRFWATGFHGFWWPSMGFTGCRFFFLNGSWRSCLIKNLVLNENLVLTENPVLIIRTVFFQELNWCRNIGTTVPNTFGVVLRKPRMTLRQRSRHFSWQSSKKRRANARVCHPHLGPSEDIFG